MYVRFGGERLETYRSNAARRWALTLLYTALAPIPLSSFAGEPTSNVGKNLLRSYAGVCLEGAIIALACIIFSVMAASPPAVDPNVSAVTAVWSYVGELSASVSTGKKPVRGFMWNSAIGMAAA